MLQILWESTDCLKSYPSLKSKKVVKFYVHISPISHAGSHLCTLALHKLIVSTLTAYIYKLKKL